MTRTPLDDRTYQREYARKRRAEKVEAANANANRCQAILSKGHPCRTPLQNRFVKMQTVPFCPTCDRKARGVCIECEAPVYGTPRKALFCALHKKLALHAAYGRYKDRNREQLAARERRRMADPEVRADRCEYKRLSRKLRPKRMAEYKKTYATRHAEQSRAYHVAYRAKHLEKRREVERLRYHGALAPRSCIACPAILTGRAKKCNDCKRLEREQARQIIAARPGMAA